MKDAVLLARAAERAPHRPSIGALWIAAESIRIGSTERATFDALTLAVADADATSPQARFAGAGFRANPFPERSQDARYHAALDALARARRAPEAFDAVSSDAPQDAVLDALIERVFAIPLPRLEASARGPLVDAVLAVESMRARRVLVLESNSGAIVEAAVVESTREGSPPFVHGALAPAPTGPVVEHGCAADALRALGLDVPLPPALSIGMVSTGTGPDDVEVVRGIRALGLRGSVVVLEPGTPFEALVDRARRWIASGSGTAALATRPGRCALVASAGFHRALAAP